MGNSMPKVVVVIPTWNTRRWLPGCLNGLRAQTFQDFKTVIVDNGSTDGSVAFIKEYYPEVRVIAFGENLGFAPAVNAGIRHSQSDYVALLNVDTEPDPNWLANLVAMIDESPAQIGSLASKMLSMANPDILDDAGNSFSWYGSARKRGKGQPAHTCIETEEVLSACGGAAFYRRSFLDDVGGLDENFTSYLEDIDLGIRGQLLGYRCLYVPSAQVLHQWRGANIPRPEYVRFSTRNRVAILLKNIPFWLLLRHLPTLMYGQFYFFLVYKMPISSLAGYLALLKTLPCLLRQRLHIQRRRKISFNTLNHLLTTDLEEPSLLDIIRKKMVGE